mmetsp:Transcript_34680/g.79094  ORF Transcript_34680/g.79094 Transcript_34680/m.79094 type:complete len:223 (+) Transcript_34680:199-867(+)
MADREVGDEGGKRLVVLALDGLANPQSLLPLCESLGVLGLDKEGVASASEVEGALQELALVHLDLLLLSQSEQSLQLPNHGCESGVAVFLGLLDVIIIGLGQPHGGEFGDNVSGVAGTHIGGPLEHEHGHGLVGFGELGEEGGHNREGVGVLRGLAQALEVALQQKRLGKLLEELVEDGDDQVGASGGGEHVLGVLVQELDLLLNLLHHCLIGGFLEQVRGV